MAVPVGPAPRSAASSPLFRRSRLLLMGGILAFVAAILLDSVLPFPWFFLPTLLGFTLLMAGILLQREARRELRQVHASTPAGPGGTRSGTVPRVSLTPDQMRTFRLILFGGSLVPALVVALVLWRVGWLTGALALQSVLLIVLTLNVGVSGARLYYIMKIQRARRAAVVSAVAAPPGPPGAPLLSGPLSSSPGPSGLVLGMRTCPRCSSYYDPAQARCTWCGQPG